MLQAFANAAQPPPSSTNSGGGQSGGPGAPEASAAPACRCPEWLPALLQLFAKRSCRERPKGPLPRRGRAPPELFQPFLKTLAELVRFVPQPVEFSLTIPNFHFANRSRVFSLRSETIQNHTLDGSSGRPKRSRNIETLLTAAGFPFWGWRLGQCIRAEQIFFWRKNRNPKHLRTECSCSSLTEAGFAFQA